VAPRIAQPPRPATAAAVVDGPPRRRRSLAGVGRPDLVGAILLAALALLVYTVSAFPRDNDYNHFVWQAAAWLEGEATIRFPVPATPGHRGNDYFQDVVEVQDPNGLPTGRGLLPFPPLPAVVLLPFVAIWGLDTDAAAVFRFLAAVDVAAAYLVLGRLRLPLSVRLLVTLFFAFGTGLWYAAAQGQTWYQAHILALFLAWLALGAALAGRAAMAGLLLGTAALARLTVVFALPVVTAGRGPIRNQLVMAGIGAAVPLTLLVSYTLLTTGQPFNPAYEEIYRREATGYPAIFPYLHYHPDWGIEDPRYLPQNLGLMLFNLPEILPPCEEPGMERRWFDPACPFLRPRADGMSLLLVSPLYLFALPALRRFARRRLVRAAVLAVALVALADLLHFSQGWVQFGYRFSNDFAPFALILVADELRRRGVDRLALGLLVAAIVVNAWGVLWGGILGW
jgi:hypothetical protein